MFYGFGNSTITIKHIQILHTNDWSSREVFEKKNDSSNHE